MQQQLLALPTYRIDGHIQTDKPIYKPDEVMFIELLLVDAFNKTLINFD